ncbi:MAG: metal ABC transporter permease [Myxococcales bacterium]|nr:metal ABC transporter permease [Myxococcales bacterium]
MTPAAAPTWDDFVVAWELFRDPILCAFAAGAVLGMLSVYVVLRRMVFVSAAVTQSAALGVAAAFYAEIHLGLAFDPVFGAAAAALGATLLLLFDPKKLGVSRESVLGWVFAATGAATVVLGSRITQEAHDIESILFGTAVLVRPLDLTLVLAVGAAVLLLQLALHRGLVFASFDPVAARVQRLPVTALQSAVLLAIGIMVGVSARALGALPVFAFSTMPALTALLLGAGVRAAFVVAAVIGALSGVLGYLCAFFWDLPVGGAQAGLACGFALAALVARSLYRLASWAARERRREAAPGGDARA